MAFRQKPKQPEFASLKTMLAQTQHQTETPLYQTIQLLIERLMQMQGVTLQDITNINASLSETNTVINILNNLLKTRTFITLNDETLYLPNSYQILAGTNITFDTTIPNELTINASGGGSAYYDSPLSDGDLSAADLIFGNGECIICQVPNVP